MFSKTVDNFSFMYNRDVESVIKELVKRNKRTLVIGEIGLDYHYDDSPDRKIQIDCFEKQLALAEELGVPVEIHSRDAQCTWEQKTPLPPK